MKGRRVRGILFIFWMLLAILATSWIFFTIFTNISMIFKEALYQFVIVICIVSMLIAIISLREIISQVELEIKKDNDKQKIIKDYYQYNQLLDPPVMNN